MKRRKFLGVSAVAIPAINFFPATLKGINRIRVYDTMEKRELGKTGIKLSILGFGGVVLTDSTPEQAAEWVKKAFEKGINYFDVAPSYGNAEERMGPALKPFRKNVFLACKTMERSAEGARKELEQSLINLQTDHFDLYQFHAVTNTEEVTQIFGPGGAMETFQKAKEEGKINYIGFSAHSAEAALLMLDHYQFDTILFPVNYACWHAGNFGPQVLEKAQKMGVAILALKAMAKQPWPEGADKIPKCWYQPITDKAEALQALRFTLSHPVTAALPPGNEDLYFMALDLADQFTPLNSDEIEHLKSKGMQGNPIFKFPQQV